MMEHFEENWHEVTSLQSKCQIRLKSLQTQILFLWLRNL